MATATAPAPSTAIVAAPRLTPDDLNALLQKEGWTEAASTTLRMKLDGGLIKTTDGQIFVYNPTKPKVPALTVRIVSPPEEYWGIWVTPEIANRAGRPELTNTYSKNWITPNAERKVWASDLAYQELKVAAAELDERPSWRAEMEVQVVPEDGNMTGDEPIYVLDLATTSVIEWRGASKAPNAGAVSELNSIRKLCALAQADESVDPATAVLNALTSLRCGGVIAEVRVATMQNQDKTNTWQILVLDPIHIQPMEFGGAAALGAGDGDPAF